MLFRSRVCAYLAAGSAACLASALLHPDEVEGLQLQVPKPKKKHRNAASLRESAPTTVPAGTIKVDDIDKAARKAGRQSADSLAERVSGIALNSDDVSREPRGTVGGRDGGRDANAKAPAAAVGAGAAAEHGSLTKEPLAKERPSRERGSSAPDHQPWAPRLRKNGFVLVFRGDLAGPGESSDRTTNADTTMPSALLSYCADRTV